MKKYIACALILVGANAFANSAVVAEAVRTAESPIVETLKGFGIVGAEAEGIAAAIRSTQNISVSALATIQGLNSLSAAQKKQLVAAAQREDISNGLSQMNAESFSSVKQVNRVARHMGVDRNVFGREVPADLQKAAYAANDKFIEKVGETLFDENAENCLKGTGSVEVTDTTGGKQKLSVKNRINAARIYAEDGNQLNGNDLSAAAQAVVAGDSVAMSRDAQAAAEAVTVYGGTCKLINRKIVAEVARQYHLN